MHDTAWANWRSENTWRLEALARGFRSSSPEDPKKIVVVDFDGTIVEWAFPGIGKFNKDIVAGMNALMGVGYAVVVSSCRNYKGWPEEDPYYRRMVEFLLQNNVPHYAVDDGTWGKIPAVLYVDDRAFGVAEFVYIEKSEAVWKQRFRLLAELIAKGERTL